MSEEDTFAVNEITTSEFESDTIDISWKIKFVPDNNESAFGNFFVKSYRRTKYFKFLHGTWTIASVTDASFFAALRGICLSNIKTDVTIVPPSDPDFFERNGCAYIDGFICWADSTNRNLNIQLVKKSCDASNLPISISYTINATDVPAGTRKVAKDEIITLKCSLTNKKLKLVYTGKNQDDVMLNLSSDLKQLYVSERLSDFKLKVGDKEFSVHKAVLAARSRVFAAMFESNMTESRHNEVKITDVEAAVMSDLIEYMYTGRIPLLSCEKALSLYSASDKYTLEGLKSKCVEFMIANLSVDNVCVIFTLADYHVDIELKRAIKLFMRQHASEVVRSRRWKIFVKSKPYLAAEILESVVLQEDGWEGQLRSKNSIANSFVSLDRAEEA